MKKILVYSFVVLLLAGCTAPVTELSFSEIDIQQAPAELNEFIQKSSEKDGYYLFKNKGNGYYLFVNAKNERTDEEVAAFSDLKLRGQNDKLMISVQKSLLPEVSVENKPLPYALYKLKLDKDYDESHLQVNGKEEVFESIW